MRRYQLPKLATEAMKDLDRAYKKLIKLKALDEDEAQSAIDDCSSCWKKTKALKQRALKEQGY